MDVHGNGSQVRDRTVCTRLSPGEMYLLNLLTSMCDTSRSGMLRAALVLVASLMLSPGKGVDARLLSGAVERVGDSWSDVGRLLESCRRNGLRIDPSRLEEVLGGGDSYRL